MLAALLIFLGLGVALPAQEFTSPVFLLSSTAALDLTSVPDFSAAGDIHHAFSRAVSTCPTQNYAVVYQSGATTADSESSFLPIGAHTHSLLTVERIQGTIDLVGVINTILMYCLNAPQGVRKVESLDTSDLELPELDTELIKESILHISLPQMEEGQTQSRRDTAIRKHEEYVRNAVSKFFDSKDYTLIYITAPARLEDVESQHETYIVAEEAEKPFVLEAEELKFI